MPFQSLRSVLLDVQRGRPCPKELPSGTHGIWDAETGGSRLGQLDITGTRESWHWKDANTTPFTGPSDGPFYLRHAAPDHRFEYPRVFTYDDLDLERATTNILPDSGTNRQLYFIDRMPSGCSSYTLAGWLTLNSAMETEWRLSWYNNTDAARFTFLSGDVLRFTKHDANNGTHPTPQSKQWYHRVISVKLLPP